MECGALFDLFNALGNLSPDEYRAGKLLLTRIGAMLSTLCLLGCVTTLFQVRSRLRARACSRPETPILPTRFHEEPDFFVLDWPVIRVILPGSHTHPKIP
jgi:hypothetical protein